MDFCTKNEVNNCIKNEVRGDILRPPRNELTHATVDINKVRKYDFPEAKNAIEEWKLQSGFYSDCSLTITKDATLSTPPA